MVLGSLEHTEVGPVAFELSQDILLTGTAQLPFEIPRLSRFVEAPSLDDHMVLRAIVARSVNDLSLDRWCAGINSLKRVLLPQ